MIRFFTCISLCYLCLLSACVPHSTFTPLTKKASIINGSVLKDSDLLAQSIVGLLNLEKNTLCTGSLIANNIILSAAHCLPKRTSNLKLIFAIDIDSIMSSLEPDIKDEFIRSASDFLAHKKSDIALIKFKGLMPLGYHPLSLIEATQSSLLKPGTQTILAGFGVNKVMATKVSDSESESLDVYCEEDDHGKKTNCITIETEGDGLLRMTTAPLASLSGSEIELDERLSGTCTGDSGGPALIKSNGTLYLFGVTSRGSVLCNETGVYTNTLSFIPWIYETIKLLK